MFQCDYENVITWLDLTINELTWLNANKFPLRQFCPASWLSIYVPTMFTISSLTIIIQCATISSDLIWINNALNVVSTILSSGNNAVIYEILVWRLFENAFLFCSIHHSRHKCFLFLTEQTPSIKWTFLQLYTDRCSVVVSFISRQEMSLRFSSSLAHISM